MLHGLGIHATVLRIKAEVRDKVGELQFESEILEGLLFLPVQNRLADHFVRHLVLDDDSGLFHAVPGVPVAGLVEPDAFVHQRIVHRDGFRDLLFAILNNGERAVVRLHGSIVVIIDPEFIDMQIKLALRNVVRLAFQTHPEIPESHNSAEQAAQHNNRHAQVCNVSCDPA